MRTLLSCAALCTVALASTGAQPPSAKDRLVALLKPLDKGDDEQRWQALIEMADLGPSAAPAVPRLIVFLRSDNEHMRLASALALGKVGKPAIAPLIEALEHKDAGVRYHACWALGANGAVAQPAIPALLKVRRLEHVDVYRRANIALGQIGKEPERVLPVLLDGLHKTGDHDALGTLDAIAGFGAAAVPHLAKLLGAEKGKGDAATYACHIVARIGPPAKALLPHLDKLVPPTGGGSEALKAMAAIGPAAVPLLKKHLTKGAPDTRAFALHCLARMVPPPWDAVAEALDDSSVEQRRRAVEALDAGGAHPAVVDGLIRALSNRDYETTVAAHIALGRRGPSAFPAIPTLIEVMFGPDALNHARSLETFRSLGHDPRPDLRKHLQAKDVRRRSLAGYWLVTRLEEKSNEALEAMRGGIDLQDAEVVREITKALAQRGIQVEKKR
jgi:HEAT repeat protein